MLCARRRCVAVYPHRVAPPPAQPDPASPRLGALLSALPAQPAAVRRALLLLAFAGFVFVALIPYARWKLPALPVFIPVVQTTLIVVDLATALLLFAQVHVTRSRPVLVVACGYTFAAAMALLHMLSFPGAFAPGGLLGGNQQTTAYLYVFWHAGFAAALLTYAIVRRSRRPAQHDGDIRPARALAVVAAAVTLSALYAVAGGAWLPPVLDGHAYSSAFHVARYGQWFLTAAAMAVFWRLPRRTMLDVWLFVVLANQFVEIGLTAIFNGGRYDLGFYAGRVFALLASSLVLGSMLFEQARLYAQLLAADETARSEQLLREGREVLRRALLAGGMGAWSVELASGRIWWSAELEVAAGWVPGSIARGVEACMRHVHPEDLPQLRRAYRTALVERSDFAIECRFLAGDGRWRWLSGRGRVESGANGRPVKIFGSLMDVTDRKQAEVARRELEAGLQEIAEDLPVMAWMARPDGSVTWYNRLWHDYTGLARHRALATAWHAAAHPQALPGLRRELQEVLRSERTFARVLQWRGRDGVYRPFLTRCVPIRGGDGTVLHWVGTCTEISEQHVAELALRTRDRETNALLDAALRDLREGRLVLAKELTSLPAALSDAVAAVRPLHASAGFSIDMRPAAEDIQVHADPRRLRQVFANLLAHAAISLTHDGRLGVSVGRDGPDAHVTLELTGTDGTAQGAATGLSLAKALVAAHGGSISVVGTGHGGAIEITVVLPCGDAAAWPLARGGHGAARSDD